MSKKHIVAADAVLEFNIVGFGVNYNIFKRRISLFVFVVRQLP